MSNSKNVLPSLGSRSDSERRQLSTDSTLDNQGGQATGRKELGDQDSRVTGTKAIEFGGAAAFVKRLISSTPKYRSGECGISTSHNS